MSISLQRSNLTFRLPKEFSSIDHVWRYQDRSFRDTLWEPIALKLEFVLARFSLEFADLPKVNAGNCKHALVP